MRLNPELRRYLWLELSTARLVGTPIVLGAVLLLVGVWEWRPGMAAGGPAALEAIAGAASVGILLLVLFWGARLAAGAVVREVADRTWDQQRLSSIGAWTMTWGKLAGSTIAATYGCVLLLAVTLVALGLLQGLYGGVGAGMHAPLGVVMAQTVIGFTAFAVLVQAAVMLAAMTTVARRESSRQLDVSLAQIGVILGAIVAVATWRDTSYGRVMAWYGMSFDALWFAIASLVAFAAWAVVGLWRRMRVELQVVSWPVMWPLFVLFVGLWLAGFQVAGSGGTTGAAVVVALTALGASYVPAVLERLDPVRLRRLFAALRTLRWGAALRLAPLWVVSHGLAALVVIVAAVMLESRGGPEMRTWIGVDAPGVLAGILVTTFLFVTRDLLLLVFAWLGRNNRRAFAAWLLWMGLLYALAPMILSAVGAYASLPVFVPLWNVPGIVSFSVPPVVWPLGWIALVLGLLRWRWRRYAAAALSKAT